MNRYWWWLWTSKFEKKNHNIDHESTSENANECKQSNRKMIKIWHEFDFKFIQKRWRIVHKSLMSKIAHVNFCDHRCWKCLNVSYWNLNVKSHDYVKFYDKCLSFTIFSFSKLQIIWQFFFHVFFSSDEKIMWKNMTNWSNDVWLKFSGSANWWSENYEYERLNWQSNSNSIYAEKTYSLMMNDFSKTSFEYVRYESFDTIFFYCHRLL